LHRDGAQGHAHHLLYRNEDEREARPAHTLKFSEKKYNAALVLPQHTKRADEIYDYRNADNAENIGPTYSVSIGLPEQFKTRANEDVQTEGVVRHGSTNANGPLP
jgi:hypothetical protein